MSTSKAVASADDGCGNIQIGYVYMGSVSSSDCESSYFWVV